jgi:arylsulfatase A-like enzyme
MRILYLDIDTLRHDHLGCYGYHRNTSPATDAVARAGVRFQNVYASDAPCLPSRTALFSGRYGIHTGVVDHAGVAADFFIEGPGRGFRSTLGETCWMQGLRNVGFHTACISPFAERHSAWWFLAGFSDVINTGKRGGETADDVEPAVTDWLMRNAERDKWFIHVNIWDPHNPYRTPEAFGNPFASEPLPDWLTEDVRRAHWDGAGPESAQDAAEFQEVSRTGRCQPHSWGAWPRQPVQMDSIREVRRMFDGYDTGIRYADDLVGKVVALLKRQGIYDDTAIIISSDHGENLGELNIYGAHMTADEATCHVPLIVRWPGMTDTLAGRSLGGFHSHVDLAATVLQLAGGEVPGNWDGQGFADALRHGTDRGRDYLVLSQMAGSCQRSVRFEDYLCIRSYHDGYHCFPDWMLFDVRQDPHMQRDLASQHPELVDHAMKLLDDWLTAAMRKATHPQDPLWTVMAAGGPEHTRGCLPGYLKRLGATGRGHWAKQLEREHRGEAGQQK